MVMVRIDDAQVRDAVTGELIQGLVGQPVKIVTRDTTTAFPIYDSIGDPIAGSVVNVTPVFTVPRIWVDIVSPADVYLDWLDEASGARGPVDFDRALRDAAASSAVSASASSSAAQAAQAAAEEAAEGVPTGGTTGQVLTKASNADRDTVWVNPSSGGSATDHNTLANLTVGDPHTQYHNDTRGDALYYRKSQVDSMVNNAASANSAADRNRANHSGTQSIATIENLQTILDGLGGTAVNSVNGETGTVTISVSNLAGTGATGRDVMGAANQAAGRTALGAAATSHTHTASQISDSTSTGRGVLTAASTAAARSAIGAGTSDLALGSTSSTAMRGDFILVDPVSVPSSGTYLVVRPPA